MTRQWSAVPMPILAGEDTATAPFQGSLPYRVENGLLTGVGSVEQVPDWRLANTGVNGTGTEGNAIAGAFPFATQGGASSPSEGVQFTFETSTNKLWLAQVAEESHAILRTIDTGYVYTETAPPQLTGFEYFGQFPVCPYGREVVTSRGGLGIFDPTGGGSFAIPSVDFGFGATPLRFRGIANHLGGTCLGWGYRDAAGNLADHALHGSRYGEADLSLDSAWTPDDTDTGPWIVNVGTLGLPIIGCAPSGVTSIIGKENEVYALSGDFIGQLGYNYIGKHGPVSTTGICSTGPMAVWMTLNGPARSVNGGSVELFATNRVTRRMRTYFDLTYTCAVHDTDRTRVGFLMRRRSTLEGLPLEAFWGDQIFWWDYVRDDFTVQGTPTTCFSVGTFRGPGQTFAAPSGTPSGLGSSVTSSSANLTWTHIGGDPSAFVSIEFRIGGAFTVVGPAAPGATTWNLASLSASTLYEWRLRYFKNGQYGSYTATQTFTTSAPSAVGDPSGLAGAVTSVYPYSGKTYAVGTVSWTSGEFASGAVTDVYMAESASFAAASLFSTIDSRTTSVTDTVLVTSPAATRYYWVRHRLATGEVGTTIGAVSITYDGAL